MKAFAMLSVTIFVILGQNSFASVDSSEIITGEDTSSSVAAMSMRSGIYRLNKAAEVLPSSAIFQGEEEQNDDNVTMAVEQGEAVQLTELPDGRVLMKLHLPNEEQDQIADQLILSRAEVATLDLKFLADGKSASLEQYESGYTDTKTASRSHHSYAKHRHHKTSYSINLGRDQNGRPAGGHGNCVSVVKALTGEGGHLGNGGAVVGSLERRGWHPVSISDRIAGMVCSWSGGWHGRGHVGRFDGQCFVPTYKGNCGDPGHSYRLRSCAARG